MEFNRKMLLIASCTASLSWIGMNYFEAPAAKGKPSGEHEFFTVALCLSCIAILKAGLELKAEFRANMAPPRGASLYLYPGIGGLIFSGAFMMLIAIGMTTYGVFSYEDAWYVGIIGLLCAMTYGAFLKDTIQSKRPLQLGDDGICTFALGRKQKQIPWEDIVRIEQVKREKAARLFGFREGYDYVVVGRHCDIRFDDTISDARLLINKLNSRVDELKIPLVAFNRLQNQPDMPTGIERNKSRVRKWFFNDNNVEYSITQLDYAEF